MMGPTAKMITTHRATNARWQNLLVKIRILGQTAPVRPDSGKSFLNLTNFFDPFPVKESTNFFFEYFLNKGGRFWYS